MKLLYYKKYKLRAIEDKLYKSMYGTGIGKLV